MANVEIVDKAVIRKEYLHGQFISYLVELPNGVIRYAYSAEELAELIKELA